MLKTLFALIRAHCHALVQIFKHLHGLGDHRCITICYMATYKVTVFGHVFRVSVPYRHTLVACECGCVFYRNPLAPAEEGEIDQVLGTFKFRSESLKS